VKEMPSPSEKGDGDIAEPGLVTGETSSMRLKQKLQEVLEEAEEARNRNTLDGGDSTASSASLRTKRSNRIAMMAEKAGKAKVSALGRGVLKGKRAGVTKKKRAPRKQKKSSFRNEGAKLELDDADMPDRTVSPEGGSTDTSMKDPSPGSGDVSMGDPADNSPEDQISGDKVATQKGMSAMGMVRRMGRQLGIFVAAVQDSTNDLRESEEYKAWRGFFGEL